MPWRYCSSDGGHLPSTFWSSCNTRCRDAPIDVTHNQRSQAVQSCYSHRCSIDTANCVIMFTRDSCSSAVIATCALGLHCCLCLRITTVPATPAATLRPAGLLSTRTLLFRRPRNSTGQTWIMSATMLWFSPDMRHATPHVMMFCVSSDKVL